MNKLLVLALSMFLAAPVIALAQDPASQQPSAGAGAAANASAHQGSEMGKSGAVKGTISEDGKSVVSDSDGKSWTIANPEVVKGHEGHHVELKGSTDAATGQINVSSVKMLKGAKNSMKKDTSQHQQ
jgi:hypothetical protein